MHTIQNQLTALGTPASAADYVRDALKILTLASVNRKSGVGAYYVVLEREQWERAKVQLEYAHALLETP